MKFLHFICSFNSTLIFVNMKTKIFNTIEVFAPVIRVFYYAMLLPLKGLCLPPPAIISSCNDIRDKSLSVAVKWLKLRVQTLLVLTFSCFKHVFKIKYAVVQQDVHCFLFTAMHGLHRGLSVMNILHRSFLNAPCWVYREVRAQSSGLVSFE